MRNEMELIGDRCVNRKKYWEQYVPLLIMSCVRYEIIRERITELFRMKMVPALIENGNILDLEQINGELKVMISSIEILEELFKKRYLK